MFSNPCGVLGPFSDDSSIGGGKCFRISSAYELIKMNLSFKTEKLGLNF